MQIDPEEHQCRQQEASRSSQTFPVENYAKQHGGSVRRSGEIDIWRRRKGGIKQARGENGNTNRNRRGSAAQAGGREISDDDRAARNYE